MTQLPAVRGALFALSAALLFGVSTPLIQRAGAELGPFTIGALLYCGAAFVGALSTRPVTRDAAVTRSDFGRIVLMAIFGAFIGPVALAWGLQRTSGTSASLMLTLEALFTVVLAKILYREVMGKRVWLAMLLLLLGGIFLIVDQERLGSVEFFGILSVLLATSAWGVDNTLSRAVADKDPSQVVRLKSIMGVSITAALALLFDERLPEWQAAVALLAIGATGYGLSLRFYLFAQREFGAGRTGSVFAFAPFIGALVATGMGERALGSGVVLGGALMFFGVVLHLLEEHAHEHTHYPMEHEHSHSHDDGHHNHFHDPMPTGKHNHTHAHERISHSHAHMPDIHHTHEH